MESDGLVKKILLTFSAGLLAATIACEDPGRKSYKQFNYHSEGVKYYNSGNYVSAKKMFQKAYMQDKNNVPIIMNYASADERSYSVYSWHAVLLRKEANRKLKRKIARNEEYWNKRIRKEGPKESKTAWNSYLYVVRLQRENLEELANYYRKFGKTEGYYNVKYDLKKVKEKEAHIERIEFFTRKIMNPRKKKSLFR